MDANLLQQTRRHFFGQCGVSMGSLALTSMLGSQPARAANIPAGIGSPLEPKLPHFAAKAKRVIYLFMAGGPSHLELLDYKPKLVQLHGQQVPESYVKNKRFAFIKLDAKLLGTNRKFSRHGESGAEISEL